MHRSFILIICFTTFAVVLSLAAAITAIWAITDTSSDLYYIRELTSSYGTLVGLSMSIICPVVFAVTNLFVLFFALLVVCCRKKATYLSCLSKTLLVLLWVCFIVETPFVIAPMAMLTDDTANELMPALVDSLNQESRGLPYSWTENYRISLLWDKLMVANECCGVSGTDDYTTKYAQRASTWYRSYRSYTLKNGSKYTGESMKIPQSCCTLKKASSLISTGDYWNIQNYLSRELCPLTLTSTYGATTGCYKQLLTQLTTFTTAMFLVQFFMLLFLLVALIACLYVVCCKSKLDAELGIEDNDDELYDSSGRRRPWPMQQRGRVGPAGMTTDAKGPEARKPPEMTTYSNQLNDMYYFTKPK